VHVQVPILFFFFFLANRLHTFDDEQMTQICDCQFEVQENTSRNQDLDFKGHI
jgi:hypothetical protein